MNSTQQEPFYIDLKKKRVSQGIEIAEISEQTKINPKYFISFEDGKFDVLPTVYTRLFLRSYAIEIGADPAKVLEKFEIHTTGKTKPKKEFKSPKSNQTEIKEGGSLIGEDDILKDLDLKKILGIIGIIFILFFLVLKLRDITAETIPEDNPINQNNAQLESEEIIIGSYLDGLTLIDNKIIKLGISPPYNLKVSSIHHSSIKITMIENGINTLNKVIPILPAKPIERTSNGKLHFELKSIEGISISLNGNEEIISQFLKPENFSDNDIAIKVIIEENGNLTAEYYKIN
jgi:hypothetical protein